MSSLNTDNTDSHKGSGYLNKLDRDQVQSSLAQIIRPLIPRNCSRYQYRFCELLPQPNALGFCSDPHSFTGKAVFINEVFMLVKRANTRNQFVIVDVAYVDAVPNIGDQIEVTPYARHDFNGKRVDEPEKEIQTSPDGTQYTVTKIILGGATTELPLPISKEHIQCPELLALIEQLENLLAPDGFRQISHLLVDAGAREFTINDPKASDIIHSPPSISFKVENAKFTGKVTIGYDRGADTYVIQTTPSIQLKSISTQTIAEIDNTVSNISLDPTEPIEVIQITDVYFDELGVRLTELIDDGAWQVIKVNVL